MTLNVFRRIAGVTRERLVLMRSEPASSIKQAKPFFKRVYRPKWDDAKKAEIEIWMDQGDSLPKFTNYDVFAFDRSCALNSGATIYYLMMVDVSFSLSREDAAWMLRYWRKGLPVTVVRRGSEAVALMGVVELGTVGPVGPVGTVGTVGVHESVGREVDSGN